MTSEYTSSAKQLRQRQTNVESILWQEIRACRLDGYKFRRQHIISPYIVDFVCLQKRIIIELDGHHHKIFTHKNYDTKRTEFLII